MPYGLLNQISRKFSAACELVRASRKRGSLAPDRLPANASLRLAICQYTHNLDGREGSEGVVRDRNVWVRKLAPYLMMAFG